MAEIDNWIKEQLKKGYKKEQIKDGLRKAGYPQNTIDSVDLFSRKQKNNKTMFFLGLIAVLIIIFIVGNYAWTHRSAREVDTSVPEMYRLSDIPSNKKELNRFVELCVGPLTYEEKVSEVSALCTLEFNKQLNIYEISYKNVDEIKAFEQGQYISFIIDLTKIIKSNIQKKVLGLNNEQSFNLCIISSPLLDDNVHPLISKEGSVVCMYNLTLNHPNRISKNGFIPDSDNISIKIYSVPFEKVTEIISKEDFIEKKRIVESYTLLDEFEKEILNFEEI